MPNGNHMDAHTIYDLTVVHLFKSFFNLEPRIVKCYRPHFNLNPALVQMLLGYCTSTIKRRFVDKFGLRAYTPSRRENLCLHLT